MEPTQTLGFTHFLAQSDAVARVMLAILLLMSLATWYLIVAKALSAWGDRKKSARFLAAFQEAASPAEAPRDLHEPFSNLTGHALQAARRGDEFLLRAMRRVIDEDTARLESGLTVLASIGSTAPFIGLFGTVWGVYHALAAIGISGQSTLDKVAGPVGEALIMTALGLAVAIPAVLAYNGFVRSNRLVLSRLDAFAHDLYAALTVQASAR
jgi:biopolymer transport protein ExbB